VCFFFFFFFFFFSSAFLLPVKVVYVVVSLSSLSLREVFSLVFWLFFLSKIYWKSFFSSFISRVSALLF